ncbi:dienelactone hydrolase [Actinomadura kijaniata]
MGKRIGALIVSLLALTALLSPPARAAIDLSAPGPDPVGYSDVSVSAAGRSFSARMWYPASSAGQNTPVAAGRFPVVSFGHGFVQSVTTYSSTTSHLASWGLIVVAPKSQGGLFPSHSAFALDLNAALSWAVAQDTTAGSRLAGHVRTDRLALSGHSMGGGASILAAAQNPAVTTVANLAAAETNPSAVSAAARVAAPMQLVGGTNDTIVPLSNQQNMYNAKPAPKQLRAIVGGFHCGFIDSSGFGCDSGQITRAAQLSITRRVLTAWFLYYLRGDTSVHDQVWGPGATSDPAVRFTGQQ